MSLLLSPSCRLNSYGILASKLCQMVQITTVSRGEASNEEDYHRNPSQRK